MPTNQFGAQETVLQRALNLVAMTLPRKGLLGDSHHIRNRHFGPEGDQDSVDSSCVTVMWWWPAHP